jgi:hypothetical protein
MLTVREARQTLSVDDRQLAEPYRDADEHRGDQRAGAREPNRTSLSGCRATHGMPTI